MIKDDIPDIIDGAMKKKNEDMGVSKAKVEQIMPPWLVRQQYLVKLLPTVP